MMEEGNVLLNCLFVGIGGFVGSVLRYLVTLIPLGAATVFPYKTLAINVIGSFVIGLICAASARSGAWNPQLVLMLKVGVCGGFTTFSTFALETDVLLRDGSWPLAVVYIVLSVVLSVAAVFAAEAVVR